MLAKSSKFLAVFFSAALLGLVLITGALAWQLSRGPISLSFLTPYLTDAISEEEQGVRVRLADTVLTWAGLERTVDLRAVGLEFLDERGGVIAAVPEASVSFSLPALMRGLLAPTSLELFGPRLRILREADGTLSLGIGGSQQTDGGAAGLLGEMLQAPDPDRATGYLSRVAVDSALIEIEDRLTGYSWQATRANISLERDARGIRADGQVTVAGDGVSARFEVSGLFDSTTAATELGVAFEGLDPSVLPKIDSRMASLERVRFPVNGTVALSLDKVLAVTAVSIDIDGGAGEFDLPELYDVPLSVAAVTLRARIGDSLSDIMIDEAVVDLGGPLLAMSGTIARGEESIGLQLDTSVTHMPVADISTYWPAEAEAAAREWIIENLTDGVVERASAAIAGTVRTGADPGFALRDLSGEFVSRDVTVHYLRPMRPARGVDGVGRFDANTLVIDIEGGGVDGLETESGRFEIHGLSGPPRGETVRIELAVAGPARDALRLLNDEPLGFMDRFGIDPELTNGDARTNVLFRFPLLNEIKVEDVEVSAASRLTGFAAPRMAFGRDLTNGDFALRVDQESLIAEGTANLSEIPISLVWTEQFEDGAPFRTRYDVQAVLDGADREALGLSAEPLLTGPVGVGVRYTLGRNRDVSGAVNLNLTNAALDLEAFDWRKPAGVEGRGAMTFAGTGERITELRDISIEAPDLSATGRATLDASGGGARLSSLHLTRLAFGDTDIAMVVELPPDAPIAVALGGTKLDLRPVVDTMFGSDDEEPSLTPMNIFIDPARPLASVRLGEETRWLGVTGSLGRNAEDWTKATLQGRLSNAGGLSLAMSSAGSLRQLTVTSDDGGGVLRALNWANTIDGGRLRVSATMSGAGKERKIGGQLDMEDFQLREGPVIARILSLATLTGIGDILSGRGISFRRAEIPFEISETEILIKGAKARGAELGIIAQGRIDRRHDTIALEGEVAPAYTLNSLIGNIPLIGTLLTGGGDGVFAATYQVTGPLDKPVVSVNPLSVLTPGIIRRLLGSFGGGSVLDGTTVEPAQPETSQ